MLNEREWAQEGVLRLPNPSALDHAKRLTATRKKKKRQSVTLFACIALQKGFLLNLLPAARYAR